MLRAFVDGGCAEAAPCLAAFGGLLFALAARSALPDPEEAVFQALLEIRAHGQRWPATGLPARFWVMGTAQRVFSRLAAPSPERPA